MANSHTDINKLFADALGYPQWQTLEIETDRYSYRAFQFSDKLTAEIQHTIEFLNAGAKEATVDKDGYWKRTLVANPIFLAWRCMMEKIRESERQIKQLTEKLAEEQQARAHYATSYTEAAKAITGIRFS